MRPRTALLLFPALAALAGCAAERPGKLPPLDQILQNEETNPAFVPMYLMGRDGTFTTNGLMPQAFGETH